MMKTFKGALNLIVDVLETIKERNLNVANVMAVKFSKRLKKTGHLYDNLARNII